MAAVRTYLFIGRRFVRAVRVTDFRFYDSLELIEREQKSIIEQYKADFTRYEKEDRKLKVVSVYENIPAQLNKQNRRFNYIF